MLMSFTFGLIRDWHDSEDIVQEVSLVAASRESVPMDDEGFSRWSRRVAKNKILHYWRSQRRSRELTVEEEFLELADQAYEEGAEPSELAVARRRALKTCLETLNAQTRTALVRRYCRGEDSETIGRQMKRSAAAVRMMLMRARDALRECIERHIAEESLT